MLSVIGWLLKAWDWFSSPTTWYVLLPIAASIAAVVTTLIEGRELSIVLLFALMFFAFSAWGLYQFDQWRERVSVPNKLGVLGPRVGVAVNGQAFELGLTLLSKASFPIEFEVVEIQTRIRNRVPDHQTDLPKTYTIPPNGQGWFHDGLIVLEDAVKEATETGYIKFKIKYGRPGRLKYELIGHKRVALPFDKDCNFLGNGSFDDVV